MKWNIIIPMAGEGKRFKEAGFNSCKYKLTAGGKSIFEWALLSFESFFDIAHFVFVVRENDNNFIQEKCTGLGINDYRIESLSEKTDGQAVTVLKGIRCLNQEEPIFIFNIDTHLKKGSFVPGEISGKYKGWLLLFKAPGTHWSFARINPQGQVLEVAEKKRISDYASVGLYYFSSAHVFKRAMTAHSKQVKARYGEKYVIPLYNYLLKKKYFVGSRVIPYESVIPLGTPEEVLRFDPGFFKKNERKTPRESARERVPGCWR
jgi:dTDP-glucose pyrophosphorylase